MKAQHTHADRTEWEGTLAEETGMLRCRQQSNATAAASSGAHFVFKAILLHNLLRLVCNA